MFTYIIGMNTLYSIELFGHRSTSSEKIRKYFHLIVGRYNVVHPPSEWVTMRLSRQEDGWQYGERKIEDDQCVRG